LTATEWVASLSPWPAEFGLGRMRKLLDALDNPQRAFPSVHVVGTNGKSTAARTVAALLRADGLDVGVYTSPHVSGWHERLDTDRRSFENAVARIRPAAESLGATQFEALTAAAYLALREAGVEVAAIEAGLGGRYDATNVIPSRVQVLTSVGLEHTRWLGPTITDIAREKLDVVTPGGTLVLGDRLHPDALAVAREVAAQRGATVVQAGSDPGVPVGALGAYQRRNFALAMAAAQAYLGELDERAVAAAAAEIRVPGRLQIVGEDPLTLLDGAHNPEGMAALAESLPELVAGRKPVVAVVSILDDKDAAGMLASLMRHCDALVFTSSHNPRALPPPTLQSLSRQLHGPPAETVRDPEAAVQRARELAGADGVVVATGSIYLVGDLVAPVGRGRASTL